MDHNLHAVSRRLIERCMALAELNRELERPTALPSDDLSQSGHATQRGRLCRQIIRPPVEHDPPQPASRSVRI